jgi:DNA-binding HxlR family transcriptional regulator
VRRKPLAHLSCSIAKAMDVIGDSWTVLIVRDALLGVTRFEDFQARLGIPRATLASRLDHLVDRGLLDRVRYRERPPRYEYRLTAAGRASRPVIVTLMTWGDQWLRDDQPPTTLIDADTGETIDPVLVDARTGRPLDELATRAVGEVTRGIAARRSAPL